MNKLSKVLCFALFSVLLTSGFPNFMMQEAHAVAATFSSLHTGDTAGDSDATTTLDLVFDQKVYVKSGANADNDEVNIKGVLSLNGGAAGDGITSAIVLEDETDGNGNGFPSAGECGANAATIVITLTTAISRDATPTIAYSGQGGAAATELKTCDDGGNVVANFAAQTATDGLRPIRNTSVTPTTTNTEITLTFVENMAKGSAFSNSHFGVSVAGSSDTFTVSNVAISGKTITLTVPVLPQLSTVSVTFSGTANSIEDTTGNDLAAISDAVTFTSNSFINTKCKGDCNPPTLGIDSRGNRVVTDGFTYNGHAIDVEKFFTPYPLITANVGKTNTAQFKIYENMGPQNIRHFTFAFGLDKDDVVSQSKAKVELDIAFDGTQTVTVTDPENALDNIKINTSNVSCMNDSSDQCLEVEIIHTFRQPLDFNIVATDVWDQSRNAWQNYYNHGIHVVGDSLNPPKEYDGIYKGKIFHLTQIDKLTAVDESGEFWSLEYGQWSKDYIKPEPKIDEPIKVMNRNHSQFKQMIQKEIEIATEKLFEFCPTCQKSWTD